MTISINKFIYNDTTYACIGKDYYTSLKASNRICKPNQRINMGYYIQSGEHTEAYYKFLQDVDIVVKE